MGWTLIVSESDTFQREALEGMHDRCYVVGATGDESARTLVRAVDVERVLVDAMDDVGRRFLAALRNLPAGRRPNVVAVGSDSPCFRSSPDVRSALTVERTVERTA